MSYQVEHQLFYLDCTFDKTKLEIYSHPIFQKIIVAFKSYIEKETLTNVGL